MKKSKNIKTNEQKIIEAQANLQVAKLLQAVENLKIGTLEFGKVYDSDIADTRKTISAVLNMIEAAQQFKKHCNNLQDIKMVTDVIDGIKMRAKYKMEIDELKERLVKGNKMFKELQSKYVDLTFKITKFLETDDKDFIGNIKPLSEYLDICCNSLVVQKCDSSNDLPF